MTDRADIDALLKNAVNIDAMNLYGSDAMAYGIMQQFARSNVSVTYTDEKGDEWDASAGYTEEDYPKDIIEKYRAQAEKDAENGVESAQDGDVAYTTDSGPRMRKRGIICFRSGCSCRCSGGGSSGQHRLSAGSSSSRQVQYPIC